MSDFVYDPNWNPDEWDMTLKYDPVNNSKVNEILTTYKNEPILEYIKALWKLIDYQKDVIDQERKMAIAIKHKFAWQQYDKKFDTNDPTNRTTMNRPPRTDSGGC